MSLNTVYEEEDPTIVSLFRAAKKGNIERVQLLLDKGVKIDHQNSDGWTPLMTAASSGENDIVSLLLDRGAKIDHQDKTGWTTLMVAVSESYEHTVNLLLERGAKIEQQNSSGNTALIVAAEYGSVSIASLLLDKGAKIEHQNRDSGWTALQYAADRGRVKMVTLLLDRGANIDHQDREGFTALINAAFLRRTSIVKLLLDRGANVNIKSKFGGTAKSYAFTPELKALLTPPWYNEMKNLPTPVAKLPVENLLNITEPTGRPKSYFNIELQTHENELDKDYVYFILNNNGFRFSEDGLHFYKDQTDSIRYKCKPGIPEHTLRPRPEQLFMEEPMRMLPYNDYNIYVIDTDFQNVKLGKVYRLTPTTKRIGRIASHYVATNGNNVSSRDHCQEDKNNVIHTITEVPASMVPVSGLNTFKLFEPVKKNAFNELGHKAQNALLLEGGRKTKRRHHARKSAKSKKQTIHRRSKTTKGR
jgi:hypothetical protein